MSLNVGVLQAERQVDFPALQGYFARGGRVACDHLAVPSKEQAAQKQTSLCHHCTVPSLCCYYAITVPALRHHCASPAPSLCQPCAITCQPCAITVPALRHATPLSAGASGIDRQKRQREGPPLSPIHSYILMPFTRLMPLNTRAMCVCVCALVSGRG